MVSEDDSFKPQLGKPKVLPGNNQSINGYGTFKKMASVHENHLTQGGGFFPPRASDRCNLLIRQTALPPIKMHEMITIFSIKNSGQSGNTKKMLHAPSLRLFVIKELPLTSKEIKMSIRSYLDDWMRHSSSLPILLGVNDVFWNTPEGYVTVVTENCSKGSLKDLLLRVESLSEAALVPLAKDLMAAVALFHSKFYSPFRSLSLRQIMFSNRGDLKLSFGFSRRLNYLSTKAKNNKEKEFLNVDSFEIGLILLKCAVGDLLDEFLQIIVGIVLLRQTCFRKSSSCQPRNVRL